MNPGTRTTSRIQTDPAENDRIEETPQLDESYFNKLLNGSLQWCALEVNTRSTHSYIAWDVADHGDIHEGHLPVVLKSYFDGGNKADSSEYDVLSLAAVSGTSGQWAALENDWKKVLKKHHRPYLHATDAVSRVGAFEGMTVDQRDKFLLDCVRAVSKHFARANVGDQQGCFGIIPIVFSVVLKDFSEVRDSIPDSPRNANEICLRATLGETLLWGRDQALCNEYHLFFDQGEPFYGFVVQLLQSKNARLDATLLNKISSRTEADMRRTPALQVADLCAWCISHSKREWQPKWLNKMMKNHMMNLWAYKNVLSTFKPDAQAEWRKWNMPRRRETP